MRLALIRGPVRVVCALACLAMVWAMACNGDESEPNDGPGGSSTTGTGGTAAGATGGSTSGTAVGATGGSTSGTAAGATGGAAGATGGGGASAAGGAGGAGGSDLDPLAGEFAHDCLPSSPECLGGWVCKVGTCSYCAADGECSNDDCNTSTFRCAAQGLCAVVGDCPSNSFCDSGACVYDHPSQGTCGVDVLYYTHDQSTFTPTYWARFTGAVSCLVSTINGGSTLTLHVFADLIGSDDYNLQLTNLRGNAVKNYLVSQGASSGSISVVAHGAQQASGIYEADRAADRRIEFTWN